MTASRCLFPLLPALLLAFLATACSSDPTPGGGVGGAGGSGGAGGAGGAGGSGGAGGAGGGNVAMCPQSADCAACCDTEVPGGKSTFDGDVYFHCGCGQADAPCRFECMEAGASVCPSPGMASAKCLECVAKYGVADVCYQAATAECLNDTTCGAYRDCLAACP